MRTFTQSRSMLGWTVRWTHKTSELTKMSKYDPSLKRFLSSSIGEQLALQANSNLSQNR